MDNINLDLNEIHVEDTFKILLATDIHLGYAENDPERSEDSFNTFEEILQLAKNHEVDFLLLGGDLFHENRPTTNCIHKCLELLKKYCMGEKPVSVEFLSDQNINFENCSQKIVNYEDPNLNISIPVFSIHGNHDDPSGPTQLSTMDILSVSGLVNYFGKWTDLTEVKVLPMLMKKGTSKLAVYGLSHIKDERLSRLFRDSKVHMYRPSEHTNDWFNIFVCHQNRVDRGINKFIPEEALPDFLDLVFWGHEHECRLKPEWNGKQQFYVSQPGSSVATSLCEGEAVSKNAGLLYVNGKKFKLEQLPLRTVRPFIFETITLSNCTLPEVDHNVANNVQNYLCERIEFLIAESAKQITGHSRQPTLPILRVRIEYNDESQCFNTIRFGQRFQAKVANPTDMVTQRKEKVHVRRERFANPNVDRADLEELLQNQEVDDLWEKINIEMLITQHFQKEGVKPLEVLSVKGLSDAAVRFIEYGDKEKLGQIIEHQKKKTEKYLLDNHVALSELDQKIEEYRLSRMRNPDNETKENNEILEAEFIPQRSAANGDSVLRIVDSDKEDSDDGFGELPPAATSTQRGRGRGGRAPRAPRARAASTRARGGRGARGAAANANVGTLNSFVVSQSSTTRNSTARSTRTTAHYVLSDSE